MSDISDPLKEVLAALADACKGLTQTEPTFCADDTTGLPTFEEQDAACVRCPGYCCYRFKIPGLRSWGRKGVGWARFLKTLLDGRYKDNPDFARQQVAELRRLFYRAPDAPDIGGPEDVTLTCREFHVAEGRCMIHDSKPQMCSMFRCKSVRWYGRTPDECVQDGKTSEEKHELRTQKKLMEEQRRFVAWINEEMREEARCLTKK